MRNLVTAPARLLAVIGIPLFLGSFAGTLHAQAVSSDDSTWTEAAVAPPAVFSTETLQTFEVSRQSSLTYGIDPARLSVDSDGVVRYVMVARSTSGALNVLYQGIRCSTAATKTYARLNGEGSWIPSPDSPWQPLDARGPTRPAMVLARQGVCDGRTINGDAKSILTTLKIGRSSTR